MDSNTVFRTFLESLSAGELEAYAKRCGTTPKYIRDHLIRGYKVPRRDLMSKLALQSRGQVTRDVLLDHFYPANLFASDLCLQQDMLRSLDGNKPT